MPAGLLGKPGMLELAARIALVLRPRPALQVPVSKALFTRVTGPEMVPYQLGAEAAGAEAAGKVKKGAAARVEVQANATAAQDGKSGVDAPYRWERRALTILDLYAGAPLAPSTSASLACASPQPCGRSLASALHAEKHRHSPHQPPLRCALPAHMQLPTSSCSASPPPAS